MTTARLVLVLNEFGQNIFFNNLLNGLYLKGTFFFKDAFYLVRFVYKNAFIVHVKCSFEIYAFTMQWYRELMFRFCFQMSLFSRDDLLSFPSFPVAWLAVSRGRLCYSLEWTLIVQLYGVFRVVIILYNYPCLNKNVHQLCVLVSFHLRFS